jgi:O-antigen/teichoic acid export membrane protein
MQVNYVMLVNAGSLVGTTVITSGLGFAYWWVAARWFAPEAVGVASASISAMMLLGTFCVLGLGTLLITELPRHPERAGSLVSTALLVVGGVGLVVGSLFALIAAHFSVQFQALGDNTTDIVTFGGGVSLTAITFVLDQALIGLLRGGLQLWRNTLFALAKLVLLFIVSAWLAQKMAVSISLTWSSANGISLLALYIFFVIKSRGFGKDCLPQWRLLHSLGRSAFEHHLLNLTLAFPALALPVLVTLLLSARMNAWFYVAWMLASFVFLIPNALTTVLHAMNSAQQATLAQKARNTIMLSCVISGLAIGFLQLSAPVLLAAFGGAYAIQASTTLRILVLAAFALTIKNHYISICRIQDRVAQALFAIVPGGILELGAAVVGAKYYGLEGLSFGWVAAVYLESLCVFPTVYASVWSAKASKEELFQDDAEIEALWVLDTVPIAIVLPHSNYGKRSYSRFRSYHSNYGTKSLGQFRPRYLPKRHLRSPSINRPLRRYSFVPYTEFPMSGLAKSRGM